MRCLAAEDVPAQSERFAMVTAGGDALLLQGAAATTIRWRAASSRRQPSVDLLDLIAARHGAHRADALARRAGVHVVGGAVRDALLGRGATRARHGRRGRRRAVGPARGGRLGGNRRTRPLGTATLRSPAATFDVVTARTEAYAAPGALPDVRPGASIEQDLARRDFTVNAIALRVADGALVEWPGAREDLAAGVLRCSPSARSRTIRRACCAWRDTPRDSGSSRIPRTDALSRRGHEWRPSRAALWAPSCGCCYGGAPAALLALERTGSGARSCTRRSLVDPALVTGAIALCPDGARANLAALATTLDRRATGAARERSTGSS